jgi:hypothetical protein
MDNPPGARFMPAMQRSICRYKSRRNSRSKKTGAVIRSSIQTPRLGFRPFASIADRPAFVAVIFGVEPLTRFAREIGPPGPKRLLWGRGISKRKFGLCHIRHLLPGAQNTLRPTIHHNQWLRGVYPRLPTGSGAAIQNWLDEHNLGVTLPSHL